MRSNRGFTLVELLLVIGIIALLIAILIPAYGQFEIFIKKQTCESNLKGIYSVFQAYAAKDGRGRYPHNVEEQSGAYWFRRCPSNVTNPIARLGYLTQVNQIIECGGRKEIFFCPFDQEAVPGDSRWDSWTSPVAGSDQDPDLTPVVSTVRIYPGYMLLTYFGFMCGYPHPNRHFTDGRYGIGTTAGDGDIPIVTDICTTYSGKPNTGWWHTELSQNDLAAKDPQYVFSHGSCNTLMNAGNVVTLGPGEIDPNAWAYTAYNVYYYFALKIK